MDGIKAETTKTFKINYKSGYKEEIYKSNEQIESG